MDQGEIHGMCRDTRGKVVETTLDPHGCLDKIFVNWNGLLRCSKGTLPITEGHYKKFCPQVWMEESKLVANCVDGGWIGASNLYTLPQWPSTADIPLNHNYFFVEEEVGDAGRCKAGLFKRPTSAGLACLEKRPDGDYVQQCEMIFPWIPGNWIAQCPSDIGVIERSEPDLDNCKRLTLRNTGKLECTRNRRAALFRRCRDGGDQSDQSGRTQFTSFRQP